MESLDCVYKTRCGGCPEGASAADVQLEQKIAPLRARYPFVEIRFTSQGRLRDRVDLICETRDGRPQLGLYERDSRQVVDFESCTMMTLPLEAWFQDFRRGLPPIQKGSVRLRVSPSGERGAWLDFANQDVKMLFEEREYLRQLSTQAFVEIGQRRKALVWKEGAPKLIDPVLKPWFETYGPEGTPLPLYGPVGGFSQSGFAANRALVQTVCELAEASGIKDWLELFCGNGNFALALAARRLSVEAVELDPLAVAGLEMSRSALPAECQLRVLQGDVYLKTKALPPILGRGLLVDPPRAGLRELFARLQDGDLPEVLLYVSCFSESFIGDAARLEALGFELQKLLVIDQFPFSTHCEWVSLFVKKR